MFFEFALEPKLVAHWCDKTGFKAFMSQFGLDTSRIISKFPKNWGRCIEDEFLHSFPTPTLLQSARKTEIISSLSKRMVKRGSKNFEPEIGWLENAEREHSERPFKNILARSNPRNNHAVTVLVSADDILEKLEALPRDCDAARTPDALLAPLIPMLRCCEFACFVDPHFDVALRFTEPLKRRLQVLMHERYGSNSPKVEIHTSVERYFKPSDARTPESEKHEASYLLNRLKSELPKIIPNGLKVRIVIWKEKPRGQKLHNRYLITDIGSVAFGTGHDCNDEAFHHSIVQGQSDDIFCLSEALHQKKWDEYIALPAFDKIADETILGSHSNP